MNDDILAMAKGFYGYGPWDARYWFIGPEAGQGKDEKNDLNARAKAWRQLGSLEVCDCREYHNLIPVLQWHREKPQPNLQRTWRPLILLLLTYLGRPLGTDNRARKNTLKEYQRGQWGMLPGDSCVIELSGLPANSFKVTRDRKSFLDERIATIQNRLGSRKRNLRLLLMYGKGSWKHFDKIAQCSFVEMNIGDATARIGTLESTVIACTPHPSHGPADSYWIELGKHLRELSQINRPALD